MMESIIISAPLSPMHGLMLRDPTDLPPSIARKIRIAEGTGCWLWTGARDARGYGNLRLADHVRKAHRVVYELLRRPLPEGWDCDHLCREPSCVRPEHIEPVPHIENVRRGAARWVSGARQRAKRRCPRGHAYTPANTYVQPSTGGRACRACDREKKRARAHAMAYAPPAPAPT